MRSPPPPLPRRSLPLLLLAASACTNGDSVRPDPGTSAGAAGAAGASTLTAGAAGAYTGPPPNAQCPSGRGPKMVPIVLPGVAAFCIDTTEVTQKQYVEFLDAKIDPAKQSRPFCVKENHTFEPRVRPDDGVSHDCPKGVYDPATRGDAPITCVTHCDAIAYCEWAGKRLCGAIGGGPRPPEETGPALTNSEWYQACSQGGKYKFPYGNDYVKDRCVDPPAPGTSMDAPIGPSKPPDPSACTGDSSPYDQVFEMVGNAAEWEDHCKAEGLICTARGGSSHAGLGVGQLAWDCATTNGLAAAVGNINAGIRCCADYR